MSRQNRTDLFLQQRDQEVDGQHGVGNNLVLFHVNVSNGDTETKDLLKLELDSGSDFVDFSTEIFVVRNRSREFTGLRKTGTQ